MRVSLEDKPWVRVGNPKTAECEAVRINLLPGILKTIAANKHVALPIRLFEVSLNLIYSYMYIFTCTCNFRCYRICCAEIISLPLSLLAFLMQ